MAEITRRMTRPLVLVVEDDEDVLRLYCRLLANFGYDTVACVNGVEALAQVAQREPNLALIDLMMPGMSGAELATALRRERPHIPIVLMTASAASDHEILALAPAAYLRKPFLLEELENVIERQGAGSSPA